MSESIRRIVAVATACLLLLGACGSDSDPVDSSAASPAVDSASTPSSSSSSDPDDANAGSEDGAEASGGVDGFPITISHAYGETVIEAKPERVATVAWANHEVPLALGVVPVVMEEATWGDDDGDGVLPWVEEQLEALGADAPQLYDPTDGIDFETIADAAPDVILASYSGLTQEDYDTLSQIAPVVAYPEIAWGTPWDEMVRMNSAALGLSAEGEQLIADLDAEIADTYAQFPELADKTVLFSYLSAEDTNTIGYYTMLDTRPAFLEKLGMGVPELVAEVSADTESFYESISSEEADLLSDVDVVITYGEADTVELLQADPLLSTMAPIANGAVVILPNATPLAAAANPSPLSIPWGLGDYLQLVADAAARSSTAS